MGPLSGLRVLDISRVLAGPYCAMILGDLGAEIIKLEIPGKGDDTRSFGPPFCGTETAYFFSVNRNKKSIAVDMKQKEGATIVKELAKQSDVLIENYIPGKLSKMGLGYSQIKEIAPKLIYCSISGYGQTGPYAQRAGYDVIASGIGGLMHITGPQDGAPCKVGVAMTDLSTGLYAYGSILAAIMERQKSGTGQHIDCNLLATQVASLVNISSNYLNAGMEAKRYGTAHESIVPYQSFKTSDGYIIIGGVNNNQFQSVCKLIDLPELCTDPRYIDNKLRVTNRKSLLHTLSERFLQKSTDEWLNIFEDSGIPYGPINTIQQVFSDPQVLHNNLIQEMDHPTAGRIRLPAPAVKFSESKLVNPPEPPPTLGQHTHQVLTQLLNMDKDEIKHLIKKGVIQ
ncbi:succinate--hydroxymethylglutarate CoA-transferase isoform X1 [Patella vulgata]|uniref:succinate--hydroxymethylglutarate CoA-transferase isoform X1 n=1 Tax=Patella vulgata TaxID=6465 RepID=UPI0024A8AC9A|nr:succinate--hydroxymethylglutarate CoA-transferase isoform X1 [Patella vulgata]XP_050418064.2 succinate--hydroxymethylglutarate CoA-transferase isoform X1 [Patella vulgata]